MISYREKIENLKENLISMQFLELSQKVDLEYEEVSISRDDICWLDSDERVLLASCFSQAGFDPKQFHVDVELFEIWKMRSSKMEMLSSFISQSVKKRSDKRLYS